MNIPKQKNIPPMPSPRENDNTHLKRVIKYKHFNSTEYKEFNNIIDLFRYIENESKGKFKAEDISIGSSSGENNILGWKSIRPVIAEKPYNIFDEDCMPIYDSRIVVGVCDLGEKEAE